MKKRIILFAIAASVGSCIDNSGETLSLRNAFAPVAPACTVQASDTIFHSSGLRDITRASLASYGYILSVQLQNNALSVSNYPVRYGNNPNVLVDANDITVDGFNLCYEFLDFRTGNEMAGQAPTVSAPSCKSAGLRTYFVNASSTVVTANSFGAISVDIFPPSITGVTDYLPEPPKELTPGEIAAVRAAKMIPATTTDAQIGQDEYNARLAAYSATVGSHLSKFGGNAFVSGLGTAPFKREIMVHVQAVGRTRDQRRMLSNEFIFGVELCAGCLTQFCAIGTDPTSLCAIGQDSGGKCAQ
jgi:hypothetical protein